MPLGTAAQTVTNLPSEPYVVDPGSFFAQTKKNVTTPRNAATPGPGLFVPFTLLQTGIVSMVRLTFVGTLTVATAAVTTSDQWPYNLMKNFNLSVNGQANLWATEGCDHQVLRDIAYPAYTEQTDTFPGTMGGGNSVGTGTYNLYLTWEVPVAIDQTSLVGSLFAQSPQTNIALNVGQALNSDLFSANPGNATIAGTWYVTETFFEIPYDSQGRLIIPDLSMMHGVTATLPAITNTGDNRLELVRTAGQLERLLFTVRSSNTNRISASGNAAASNKIDAVRLEYGGNQRPYVWNPATLLASQNNEDYGTQLAYNYLAIDTLKQNPVRDAIVMAGLTELALVVTVDPSVTITAGQGSARVIEEILY